MVDVNGAAVVRRWRCSSRSASAVLDDDRGGRASRPRGGVLAPHAAVPPRHLLLLLLLVLVVVARRRRPHAVLGSHVAAHLDRLVDVVDLAQQPQVVVAGSGSGHLR